MDTKKELKDQCLSIAKFLEQKDHGKNEDGEQYAVYDYLQEVYNIDYIINHNKIYKGARLLVAGGGPNIYVDTQEKQVVGYWLDDKIEVPYYEDNLGLDDYLEEIATNLFNLNT